MKKLIYILPVVAMLASCSSQTYVKKDAVAIGFPKSTKTKADTATETNQGVTRTITVTQPMVGMIPKATAFKMSGDFADNVAVSVGSDGQLTYFPAPSDISASSAPTSLGDGWYLNNQGLGENSVFTKYTFEEYSKLPEVPSVEQLKAAIIPGAKVTDMIQLPYNISEARENVARIKEYINNL